MSSTARRAKPRSGRVAELRKNTEVYLILLLPLVWLILFCYLPLVGAQIAFKDFRVSEGIWGSAWVGFKHFLRFFQSYEFWGLLYNTMSLSLYQIVAGTIACVALALMLNEMRSGPLKKLLQTITYAPHFISTVVMAGLIVSFLSVSQGPIARFLSSVNAEMPDFLGNPQAFQTIFVLSEIWQHNGWWAILFIAVLAGVDPQQHEAAMLDGASRWQRIWHINLPAILPTIAIVTVMNLGGIMNVGFQKVLLLQNSLNLESSDVIATYVYRIGLVGSQYGYSAAVGFFNSAVNLVLLWLANLVARRLRVGVLW